jgi:DinB superfamily
MRPAPSEYFAPFERYISLVGEQDIVPAMSAQAQDLRARLDALTESQAGFRYAPGKWTPREMLGHVIDSERIFGYRALCLARGESQSLPGFEQDDYAAFAGHETVPFTELVDEFAALRSSHVHMFGHFDAHAWTRVGLVNGNPTTARAMAFVIVGHARHHVNVLRERYGLFI